MPRWIPHQSYPFDHQDLEPSDFSNKEFAIWLSAWVDADGYIGFNRVRIHKKRHGSRGITYRPVLQVGNTYRKPLDIMHKKYGGCIHYTKPRGKNQGCFRWQTENMTTVAVLKDIVPFLVRKKKQAQIILECRTKKISRTYIGRSLTDEEMALLEECRQKVHALNQQGNNRWTGYVE